MKREYPALGGAVSKYVANPLALILCIFFISVYYVDLTITELVTICVTTFGVLVTLAGLSFSIKFDKDSPLDPKQFIYAGTKLSHASVLCLQLVFVVLARHVIATKLSDYVVATRIAETVLKIAWMFVSTLAMWTAYWGISCLNQQLFADWESRIEKLNTAESEQGGADQPATAPESKSEGDDRPKPESEGARSSGWQASNVLRRMNATRIIVGLAVLIFTIGPLLGLAHLSADIRYFDFRAIFAKSDIEFPMLSSMLWRFGPLALWSYITPIALAIAAASSLRTPLSGVALTSILAASILQFLATLAVNSPYFKATHIMANPTPGPFPMGPLFANIALLGVSLGLAFFAVLKMIASSRR